MKQPNNQAGEANKAVARLDEIKVHLRDAEATFRSEIAPVVARFADAIAPHIAERVKCERVIEEFVRIQLSDNNKGTRTVKFDVGGRAGLRKVDILDFAEVEGRPADEEIIVGALLQAGLKKYIRTRRVPAIDKIKSDLKQKFIDAKTLAQCYLIHRFGDKFWVETPGDMLAKQMVGQDASGSDE
jgi:Gam-like protein